MAKDKEDTKPYPALSLILHNGKTYSAGQVLELTESEAKPLREVGALGDALKPKAAPAA